MLKRKSIKYSSLAVCTAILISIICWNSNLFAASAVTSDFNQLNYTQLLTEMGAGWNLGNQLEASVNGTPSETSWNNPTITKELITKVKAAGFKSIRIPISYLSKIGSAPNYTIDSVWLDRIKEVVDYAYSQGLYVMINMHGDGYPNVIGSWLLVTSKDQSTIKDKYQKIWQQVANKFIDYDEHLIFESMNEEFDGDWDTPKIEDYNNLNAYNQIFVDTVRKTGGNNSARWLLIPGWNTDISFTTGDYGFQMPSDNYRSSTIPNSEKRIAISAHYYSPWDFCGDTSSPITQWGSKATNPDKKSDWGQEDFMDSQLNAMYTKFVKLGYPVIIGEFSTADKSNADPTNNSFREYFTKTLSSTCKKYGAVPVFWDNGWNGDGGMSLFDRSNLKVTQQGIINAMMDGMKLTPAFDPSVTPVLVTPTPIPDGSFDVKYETYGGSTANLTIKNNLTTSNINGWTMEFTFPGDQKITSMWGGTYTQNGKNVTIKNADYTSKISANGGSVTLGFNMSFTGTNDKPSYVKINGSKCQLVPNATATPTK